jgi:hypothetical protein
VAKILCERFFSERPPDPAIAIFKWINAHEVQMHQPGTGECGQRCSARWCGIIELSNKVSQFCWNSFRWRGLEMNRWLVDRSGDNLHRFIMRVVAAYGFYNFVIAQEMTVPGEQFQCTNLRIW